MLASGTSKELSMATGSSSNANYEDSVKTSSKEAEENKVEALVLPDIHLLQDLAKVCGKACPCIDEGTFERSKGALGQPCLILTVHLCSGI